VGAFKTVSTKHINQFHGTPSEAVWQRNYWERVIRNENQLNHLLQYIAESPLNWETDKLYSEAHLR